MQKYTYLIIEHINPAFTHVSVAVLITAPKRYLPHFIYKTDSPIEENIFYFV